VAWILIILLIFLGGLIAPFGDLLGTKIGKARFSILKLRPKKTATIITIITGSFISSISIGLLLLVSEEFRQRLFVDIPLLQKTLVESKKSLIPLQQEREKLEDKILQKEKELNLLKNSINEFRRGNVVIKKGQSLFIAEVDSNKNLNIKLELSNIINRANKYVQEIVIPSKKEPTNILLWRPSDIAKIENLIEKNGSWILIIKSATNVLKGDDYVFVFPELLENKLVVKKGTIITTTILEKSDLTSKSINNTINLLIKQTRDAVKKKGSIVNEITTRGNFLKKLKDYLKSDQNVKFQLEVLSLRDSKTAEPIIVEFNITKLQP
tara:strand:- start:463 stop:1434 length:972 start_codon:yes stop_codon:yes gene_type:complete